MKPDIQKIILSLLRGSCEPDVPTSGHFQELVSRVFEEQVQGIVYRQLKQRQDQPPLARSLENAYYAGLVANTYRAHAVEELEARLARKKTPVLLVKGMALINEAYPDSGMRPMEDIDVIIRPEDRQAVEKILVSCGYARQPDYPLTFEKKGILIDLHTDFFHNDRIQSRKYLRPLDVNQVFKNSLPWKNGFYWVRRPDDADHLIFLCHHMIKHSFSKLIWLYDAHQILNYHNHNFQQKLARQAAAGHQQRPVGYVLFLLEKMLGYEIPKDSALAGYVRQLTPLEKGILTLRVNGASMGDLGNLLWMFCLPGPGKRLSYAIETLFPNKEVLQREQSSSPHPTNSVYVNRLLVLQRQLFLNLALVFQAFLRRRAS